MAKYDAKPFHTRDYIVTSLAFFVVAVDRYSFFVSSLKFYSLNDLFKLLQGKDEGSGNNCCVI
jgi:hypothetical protein